MRNGRRFSSAFWFAVALVVVTFAVLLFLHSEDLVDTAGTIYDQSWRRYERARLIVEKGKKVDVDAQQIRSALMIYRMRTGRKPVEDSAAVFRALQGENANKTVYVLREDESVGSDGSFLDPWGTPYKLDSSGNRIIVRSAGPNRQFDRTGEKKFDDLIK